MARAFSSLRERRPSHRRLGLRQPPRAVARVSNAEGKVIDDNKPVNRPVLTRDQNALLTSILEGVVRSGHRQARRSARPSRRREDRHD